MLLPHSDVTHMNTPKSEERLSNPGSTWMQQKPSVSVPVHPKGVGWLEAGDSGEEELDSIPQSGTTVPLRRVLSCWKQERDKHKLLTHNLKKSSNPQMNPHRKCKTVNKWIKHTCSFPLCQWSVWLFAIVSENTLSSFCKRLSLFLLIRNRDITITHNRRGNGLDNILIEILHQKISFQATREEDSALIEHRPLASN